MYDLIIIGLGPAGLNAGVYASKANLKTLAIEKESPGGLLLKLKEENKEISIGLHWIQFLLVKLKICLLYLMIY